MAQSLRKEVFNGLIWSFVERFSGQIIGFVAIVVMSRLLSQAEYGLVGMIMIFIDIAQGLVGSGVSPALEAGPECRRQFYCLLFQSRDFCGIVSYIVLRRSVDRILLWTA